MDEVNSTIETQQKANEWDGLVSWESQGGHHNLGLQEVNVDFEHKKGSSGAEQICAPKVRGKLSSLFNKYMS